MQHPLIQYFNTFLDLTEEEVAFLEQHIPIIHVKSDTYLLQAGQVSTAFYFVIEGIIRMFYVVDGAEKTTYFYEKNDFVSSYESFTKQLPSKHYLQPIKAARVAVFPKEVVSEIIERFPRFEMISRRIMEEELSTYQDMLSAFVSLNAEQRYQALLAEKPHLLREIPQIHLSTYLGVSPETLSRIKRRIKER